MMKMIGRIYFAGFILCSLLLSACSQSKQPDVQQIVNDAIAAHGSQLLDQAIVEFKLRDKQYRVLRDQGAFVYSRTFTDDSTNQRVHDVLSNSGFKRTTNDKETVLPNDKQAAYAASVNSVVYFALLPYFLNDAAVQKEYLGEAELKGQPYYKVKVTFTKESGGEDHEDVYVYWFHQQTHYMDYLAYTFKEEEGGIGSRFRVAINPREVNGIRFQDYLNYTTKEKFAVENYDKAFEAGNLEKVSEIALEDIKVKLGL